jgi:hypothetical protein
MPIEEITHEIAFKETNCADFNGGVLVSLELQLELVGCVEGVNKDRTRGDAFVIAEVDGEKVYFGIVIGRDKE